MADLVITEKQKLVEIANAIREKSGTSDAMAFDALASAIGDIEVGISLSNCQKVIVGEITPSEDIATNYVIHSGMKFGEINHPYTDWSNTLPVFCLVDMTYVGDSGSPEMFNYSIMGLHFGNLTRTQGCARGYYRSSSGSYVSLTYLGAVGDFCNESGNGMFSDVYELCFKVYLTSSKKLLAGHTYGYMFIIRNDVA